MTALYKFQHYALPILADAAESVPVIGTALSYYLNGVNELIEENVAPEVIDPTYYMQKKEDIPVFDIFENQTGKKYRGAGDLGPVPKAQMKKSMKKIHPINNDDSLSLPFNASKINPVIPPPFAPIIPPYYLPHYGFTEHYPIQQPVIGIARGDSLNITHPPRTKQPNASMPPAGGFTDHIGVSRDKTPRVSGFTGRAFY